VLALRRVELHVSLKGSQETQDFHILRFHLGFRSFIASAGLALAICVLSDMAVKFVTPSTARHSPRSN
jgi:hypothetical protein